MAGCRPDAWRPGVIRGRRKGASPGRRSAPRNVAAEPASAFPSPGRSKMRLPSMSAARHAVTLSGTGRHGERAHCRRSGRFGLRRCPVFKTSVAGCSVRPHADGVRPGWDAGRRWVRSRSGTGSGRLRGQREPDHALRRVARWAGERRRMLRPRPRCATSPVRAAWSGQPLSAGARARREWVFRGRFPRRGDAGLVV